MALQLRNENQVKGFLLPKLQEAVNYVTQQILEQNRQLVEEIIYGSYSPTEYQRTEVFKEEWSTGSKTISSQSKIEGTFQYDPFPSHMGIWDGEPIDEYLAEIIYDGLSGAIYEPGYAKDSERFAGQAWTDKRSVWDALNKWLGVRKMRELLSQGMDSVGLKYQWHNTSMKVEKN